MKTRLPTDRPLKTRCDATRATSEKAPSNVAAMRREMYCGGASTTLRT